MSYNMKKGIAINRCFDEEMLKQLPMDLDYAAVLEFRRAWDKIVTARQQLSAENGMFMIRIEFFPEEK